MVAGLAYRSFRGRGGSLALPASTNTAFNFKQDGMERKRNCKNANETLTLTLTPFLAWE